MNKIEFELIDLTQGNKSPGDFYDIDYPWIIINDIFIGNTEDL